MTAEERLEVLLRLAELPTAVREATAPPEAVARLEAAGFELSTDVWGDPVARAPESREYHRVGRCVEHLDLVGDEAALAVATVFELRGAAAARAYRAELAEDARRRERNATKRARRGRRG
jgi:hypothetical protein